MPHSLGRGDDVRAGEAERGEATIGPSNAAKPPSPPARDVLEKDALDRILGAEREDLLARRRDGRDSSPDVHTD
jgi:hypothetical protein